MTYLKDYSAQFDPAFVLLLIPGIERLTSLVITIIYRRIKDYPF